jgi:hypothetical protein
MLLQRFSVPTRRGKLTITGTPIDAKNGKLRWKHVYVNVSKITFT